MSARAHRRQPVHTLYVPADRFRASTAADAGRAALRLLHTHAAGPDDLAAAFEIDPAPLAEVVRERVAAKLATEPVEDLRVDFEDGYLGRDDAEEDRDAVATARALADARRAGALPPFFGLRVKPFGDGLAARSVRTLDRFVGALLEAAGGLPDGFRVTFPKIVAVEHVAAFAETLGGLEDTQGLEAGTLRFEVQIETPESVVTPDGRSALPGIVAAAAGRLDAAHFGVYDYTAALGLPPAAQRLDHPACDHARHVMQVSLAGTGVHLADGSTNAVPEGDGADEVRRVWRRHAADVRHSLRHGFFQGWDLHHAHLVSRFTTVYAFLLADLDAVCERLARWRGTSGGPAGAGVLDEPATVRALLAQLRRAVECGALSEVEAYEKAQIDPSDFWTA